MDLTYYKNNHAENSYDFLKEFFIENWKDLNEKTSQKICAESPRAVLDIGFGTGDILHTVSKSLPEDSQIVAIEPNNSMIEAAQKKYTFPKNVEISQIDLENFKSDIVFDKVSLCIVYHNLPKELRDLKKILEFLKPGGELVFTDFVRRDSFIDFIQERGAAVKKALDSGVSESVANSVYIQEMEDDTLTRHEVENLLNSSGLINVEKFWDNGSYIGYTGRKLK